MSQPKEVKQILLVYEDGDVTSLSTGFAGGLGENGERLHMIFANMDSEDILRTVYALASFVSNAIDKFESMQKQEEGDSEEDRRD